MKEIIKATKTAPTTSLNITKKKLDSPLWSNILLTNKNNATPVPSLNNDSLSIIEVTFLESPNLFKIPVAAIGSVGATIHPNKIENHMLIFILHIKIYSNLFNNIIL